MLPPPQPAPPAEPAEPRIPPASGVVDRAAAGLLWLVRRVPLSWASGAAWVLAGLWWTIFPLRKRIAVENLRAALPDAPVRPVLVRMMHDLVLGYIELIQFERVQIEVDGELHARGAVLLAGHGGAWDVALLAWGRLLPLSIFLRTPKNVRVQALLAQVRDENGVHRLETGAGMDAAYRALADGRNVMFIQDQRHNKGPALPFLGRPARTSLGAAAAAARTGCHLYGCWQWREGTGRHRLLIERLHVEGDLESVTTALNAFYARQIAARPHGWLWLHDRWK